MEGPLAFEATAIFPFKANRIYRVYFAPDELLFVRLGNEVNRAVAFQFGLIGLLVAHFMEKKAKKRVETVRQLSEQASPEELLAGDKENFRATPDDLEEPRIELSSFWHKLNYPQVPHHGLLRFRHKKEG